MRNIEEIKNEIFSRSKKRIKKRRRIISVMLSLCVCIVGVITAFALKEPPVSADNFNGLEEEFDLLLDEECQSVSENVVKVKYGSKNFTSKEKIIEITDALQYIIDAANDDSESGVKAHSVTDSSVDLYGEDNSARLYIITESGIQMEYIIGSNTLADISTGVVYSMSEDNRRDLIDALK